MKCIRTGVQEVVADKGYHSNDVMVGLSEMEVRTYVAEPDRGTRNWDGKEAEKASGVRQSAARSGRTRQAAAAATGRADRDGTSRISSTPADWTGCTCEAWRTCTRSS